MRYFGSYNIEGVEESLVEAEMSCVEVGARFSNTGKEIQSNETSNEINERPKRLVFADDFTVAGKLQELRSWWDSIVSHGPNIGYYAKASKNWLTVKERYFDGTIKIFEGTGVKITVKGGRHRGAIVGSKE